jgi:hypothetical protein
VLSFYVLLNLIYKIWGYTCLYIFTRDLVWSKNEKKFEGERNGNRVRKVDIADERPT